MRPLRMKGWISMLSMSTDGIFVSSVSSGGTFRIYVREAFCRSGHFVPMTRFMLVACHRFVGLVP